MKTLLLKLFRDIKISIGGFISIIFVIGIGSSFFTGLSSSTRSIDDLVNEYYTEYNFLDYVGYFEGVTYDDLISYEDNKEIQDFELRHSFDTQVYINGRNTDLRVHTLTQDINKPYLHEGNLPGVGEIVVDKFYCELNNLNIGDNIEFEYNGMPFSLKISGLIDSTEYIYKVKDELSMSFDFGEFGISYINEDTLKNKFEESNIPFVYTDVLVKSSEDLYNKGIFEDIPSFVTLIGRDKHISDVYFKGALDQIESIIVVFPLIFFLVAGVITFISMSKTIENQRTQIGVMGALGFSSSRIYLLYILYSSIAALIGSLVGGSLGMAFLPKVILGTFEQQYILPMTNLDIYPEYVLYALIISLLFAVVSTVISCYKTLREYPANTLRPKPPKKPKHMFIERFSFFNRISFISKIIIRNIFYNRMRLILSSIGIIGSIMFLITGFSLRANVAKMIDYEQSVAQYDFEIQLKSPVDESEILSYNDGIDSVDLIGNLYGELVLEGEENLNIPVKVVKDNNTSISLSNIDGDNIDFNDSSVVIPTKISEDYGINIGDNINVLLKLGEETRDVTLKVSDIGKMYTTHVIYISDEVLKSHGIELPLINSFVKVKNKESMNNILNLLSENDNIEKVILSSDMGDKISELMDMMNMVILIIIVGAAILAIAVVYNITSINILERTREIATLLVLGYYDKEINKLIFIENIVLSVFGGVLGIPFGMLLLNYMQTLIVERGVNLPPGTPISSIVLSFVMIMLFSMFTNMLLRNKVLKINMIEALKGVE